MTHPPVGHGALITLPARDADLLHTTAVAWTGGATTPYAQTQTLLTAFHTYLRFDPSAVPPPGADPLVWMLSAGRGTDLGLTTLFIMLGRALGLPLRLVEGYMPGTYDTAQHRYVVHGRDASVWAQLIIPGVGWADLYPVGETRMIPPSLSGTGPHPVPVSSPSGSSGATHGTTPSPSGNSGGSPPSFLPPLLAPPSVLPDAGSGWMMVLLVLVLTFLIVLWWRWRSVRVGTVRIFFTLVAKAAYRARIGLRPSDTATEATAKVMAVLPPSLARAVAEANAAYIADVYAGVPSPLSQLGQLWHQVRARLDRAALRAYLVNEETHQ